MEDAALAIGPDGSVVEVRASLSGLDLAKLQAQDGQAPGRSLPAILGFR